MTNMATYMCAQRKLDRTLDQITALKRVIEASKADLAAGVGDTVKLLKRLGDSTAKMAEKIERLPYWYEITDRIMAELQNEHNARKGG